MSSRLPDLRRALASASLYQRFQDLLGARQIYRLLAARLDLRAGERILDVGCGPAAILAELPAGIEYEGFDESEAYVAEARRLHGKRGTFRVGRVESETLADLPPFDAVLASGILHHLDDEVASGLLHRVVDALRPGGRLVTYDPCTLEGQSWISRQLVTRDRGAHVRAADDYATLARRAFDHVEPQILQGHLRVPYTACVLRCIRPDR